MERGAEVRLPTAFGDFRAIAFTSADATHIALISGSLLEDDATLVRIHSECLTGDVFGSMRCDCGEQLHSSLELIAEAGGLIVYLRGHEGRGIGLADKIEAYALQDTGLDTVDANVHLGLPIDSRQYDEAASVLKHLGVSRARLLTNNPEKPSALELHGIEVVERIPLQSPPNEHNLNYLLTKRLRMGHLLENI